MVSGSTIGVHAGLGLRLSESRRDRSRPDEVRFAYRVRIWMAIASPTRVRTPARTRSSRLQPRVRHAGLEGVDVSAMPRQRHEADDHAEADHGESQPGRDRACGPRAPGRRRTRCRGSGRRTGRSGSRSPSAPATSGSTPGTSARPRGRPADPRPASRFRNRPGFERLLARHTFLLLDSGATIRERRTHIGLFSHGDSPQNTLDPVG